jgi:two-component system phosphate regulon sensor histidine kinase PhoR
MFKSSFFWRLYAGFVGVILICALIINVLLGNYVRDNNANKLEQDLLTRASFLKEFALPHLLTSNNKASELQQKVRLLDQQIASRLTVIKASGEVLADSRKNPQDMDNHLMRPEIQMALRSGPGQAERYSDTVKQNMKYLALALYAEETETLLGFVRVALPQSEIIEQQTRLTQYIITGCVIAALIALVFGFYFARRFALPIQALTQSAEAIAKGDYQQRVYLNNKDEIGKLGKAFNFMAASAHDRVQHITEDRNKLATILSGLVEGVVAVDEQQNIIHINEAAARSLNISASASLGTSIWRCVHIVEIHEILKKIFTEGGTSQNQVRIPGEIKDTVIEVYGAALSDNDGSHGAILVLHDVSELEMLENVRRDFVTNASHELKTPLTAIRGVIETILHDPEMDKETLWHFLQRVQAQTERLVNIVSDLMALSRLESGKNSNYQPTSLKAVLNQSIKSFTPIAAEKDIDLSYKFDTSTDTDTDDDCRILGDAHALGQLFDNLIDNALKYTPEKGRVNIDLKPKQAEKTISVEVSDNGLGISKTAQARIFERFYRVDKGRSRELGGTGLGLAISKHIVEQHHGNITLNSALGQGSRFEVSFPLI